MIKSGKGGWVSKRADTIKAKGKGDIQTYWINVQSQASSQGSEASDGDLDEQETARKDRLIEWVVETFVPIIKQIVSLREAKSRSGTKMENAKDNSAFQLGLSPLDEVKEIITLPEFDSKAAQAREKLAEVVLEPIVIEQLRFYVTCIANLYRQNDFHNFEHASTSKFFALMPAVSQNSNTPIGTFAFETDHVTMSVIKLLSRIIAPADVANDDEDPNAAAMHDYTYGITSDPMTQLACAFSALIHDVDHTVSTDHDNELSLCSSAELNQLLHYRVYLSTGIVKRAACKAESEVGHSLQQSKCS